MTNLTKKSSVAARAAAATAVDAVLTHGRNLDDALVKAGVQSGEAASQAMTRALAYGALRTHLRNKRLLEQLVDRPFRRRDNIVIALLSVGLYALMDARKPDYAVVSSTVDAVAALQRPRMRGAVNAILRRYLREHDKLLAAANQHADARWLHPDWLINRVRADWPDHWEAVLTAGSQQAPMWLRINSARIDRMTWLAQLQQSAIASGAAHPGIETAVMLDAAVSVEALPGFATGEVSVQDAASQLAAPLLDAQPGMRVLDACAAPGGKSTHILERCPELAELVAVDRSAARTRLIADNLQRLGQTATLVEGDAATPADWWDGRQFDRILVDAPCSATGVIRRHPDIAYLRRESDLPQLAATQLTLLQQLWPLLKPGGRMLYSTCSLLRAENSDVVAAMLQQTPAARVIKPDLPEAVEALSDKDAGVQLLPGNGAGNTDGFYYALMERRPDSTR